MSRPRFIQIGSVRYEVAPDELEDDGAFGKLLKKGQKILVQRAQAPDCERDTVLHETMHAILFHTGTLSGMNWTSDQEEAIVSAITPLLLDTLQRNPKLVSYLTEKT